jgi:glutamine synthetase
MAVPLDWQSLDQGGKIIAEYVWIGGSGDDIRSKCKTYQRDVISSIDQLDSWNFDGSSTMQAEGRDSEVFLTPRKVIPDPIRGGKNVLVMCDTWLPSGVPANTNFRAEADKIMKLCAHERPWFSFEQEYLLREPISSRPIGFPVGGYARPQGPYYCSSGAENSFGRDVADAHYKACLAAGLNVTGINAEVFPGQWEYQIGPCVGIDSGDSMWLTRFLLKRVAEFFNVSVDFTPKPVLGDWNGSGAHCNVSTLSTMIEGGMGVINTYIERLSRRHALHMEVYGLHNDLRLTGKHETASIERFSSGVANRGCSIRIPRDTNKNGFGYFEDRRPAANCDPYLVSAMIADTAILEGCHSEGLIEHYRKWKASEASSH